MTEDTDSRQLPVSVRRDTVGRAWLTARIVFVTALQAALVLLAVRIVLDLFGASRGVQFMVFVTRTTEPMLIPFRGLFPVQRIGTSGILDYSALTALVVYTAAVALLEAILIPPSFLRRP